MLESNLPVLYAQRAAKEKLLVEAHEDELREDPKSILSLNLKTGMSINFPVHATCRPTKVCARICYACKPNSRLNMTNALKKSWRNYFFFTTHTTAEIADKIAIEFEKLNRKIGAPFLRWNGVGDLFSEAVEVLNYMAKHYQIKHLVYSRRAEMVNRVDVSPRLAINYSLDEANWTTWTKITRPQTNFTFLRTSSFMPPASVPVDIVFPSQQDAKNLPADVRDCPADRFITPILKQNACIACQLCSRLKRKGQLRRKKTWATQAIQTMSVPMT